MIEPNIIDELRAIRIEMRRMAENQMLLHRSLDSMNRRFDGMRDDLELMIRTEIGGLLAHLETRLEQRIDAAVEKITG